MSVEADYVFKVLIVGDYAVGKTSLIGRYIEKEFVKEYKPTLGVNLILKRIELKGADGNIITVHAVYWDIAGQEKYEKVRSLYYKGATAALVVYDVTRVDTFKNIQEKWIKDIKDHVGDDFTFILVGNKNDLENIKKVSKEQGLSLKKELNAFDFIETSAKTGENVDVAFEKLLRKLLKEAGAKI
ncbi:MAG: Rab family GTPase [Promethearchaeota archaeon]